MALTADVVVVGGGMAGACAAIAAREKGAKVLLVARASGATALSSGAIDFGGAAEDATVGEGVRALARQPGHPYALLGDSLPALVQSRIEGLDADVYSREVRRTVRSQRFAAYRYAAANAFRYPPRVLAQLVAGTVRGKLLGVFE